ncbi:unnamed protein product [Ceratitis capitata]|uniref:(Mediterranean fruit fly) hypothetical protein n=1 Tax=Ceratitis capitata TaxID=7213 RepID=A0A811UH57_CERCA|nr:unnamed protein product [Ceratitis capitata]
MFHVQCHQRGQHQRQPFIYEDKQLVFFGTLDSALGYCLALPEKVRIEDSISMPLIFFYQVFNENSGDFKNMSQIPLLV